MAGETDAPRKPVVDNSAPDDRSGVSEPERRPLPRIKPGWTIKGL